MCYNYEMSQAIVCMKTRDGTVRRRAADDFDFLPRDPSWPQLCASLAARGAIAVWVELEAQLTAGETIEIPMCERCGCDPLAWVHDERNEEHHGLVPIKRTSSNGVYTVVAQGDGEKPWILKRGP